MSNVDVLEAVRAAGVIPVVTLPDIKAVAPVCEALMDAGLPIVEVTFRSDVAAAAIEEITNRFPDMHVGAGTVITVAQLESAHAAGARFAVAPGLDEDIMMRAQQLAIPFWPGVCTPTEIGRAIAAGMRILKFFPAGALGGAPVIKAMLAPYRHLGVEVVPTGGIDADSAVEYWSLPGVLAVGGSWIAPTTVVSNGDWAEVRRRASVAIEKYRVVRSAGVATDTAAS